MTTILVPIESLEGAVLPVSLEILTAARQLAATTGGEVEALVLSGDAAKLTSKLGAADRIIAVSHPALEHYHPEAHLMVIAGIIQQRKPCAVLFAYSTAGLDLAPALAEKLQWPMIGYCTAISLDNGRINAQSQGFGGRLTVASQAALPAILTIMPGAFAEAEASGNPPIENWQPPALLSKLHMTRVKGISPVPGGVDISEAEKIVCVGRGIKDKDSIEAARGLAEILGAELAGSRPVVDNGWLPKERQVGKSGRKVKPKLYFALGVSGAPEHLEGMKSSALIIAINTDKTAPIFGCAHYGATCDLFELLPKLSQQLR
ncbi:MAG: electron transfer flavoprotein subunit alpha/FixB family protein [Hyphomicrobiales bacterium]|nr:electron transfer flavoprotein subunit alpha/FixB family protein [Hyphomicrobiales bacterium]